MAPRARSDAQALDAQDELQQLRDLNRSLQDRLSALQARADLVELSRDAVIITDLDDRITYWNRASEQRFGWARDEAVGRLLHDLLKSRAPEPMDTLHAGVLAAGRWEGELTHTCKDGSELAADTRWEVLRSADGHAAYFAMTHRDVDFSEQLEASRSRTARQYLELFEGIHDAVLIADPERGIVDINPAFTAMFGYELDEIRGRTTSCLYADEADYERMGASLREFYGESRFTLMPTYRRKNGEAFPGESNVYYQKDVDGKVTGFIALIQDRTGRLKAESALQQAYAELKETDRYKDEFLSIISHELRTPLNFIMGFASILDDEIPGPINDQQRNCIERILNGSDRMLALVNNLLDMSRIAAGQFQIAPAATCLAPLIDETISTLEPHASDKGVVVEAVVDALAPMWMDGDRILQVLTNLVNNAIKFTPRGGRVQIRARVQEDVLRVEVADTGIGIAAEDLPKLFTRFRQLDMSATRASGGTGLGLSIVKTIVETHGGRVGVESTPGMGSTFWFELPTHPMTER